MATLSSFSAQGGRSEQQDRYLSVELPSGRLLAVMDGHGGSAAADHLTRELTRVFDSALKRTPGDLDQALKNTIKELSRQTEKELSGSTLSMVFIPMGETQAHVAVLGDSPVVIRGEKDVINISPMHNARSNVVELESALGKGALFVGGYLEDPEVPGYGLQMSRALGDSRLSRILNRQPDVYSVPLGKNSFILLASDGVLKGSDLDFDSQLKDLVRRANDTWDAAMWVEDALRRQTGDNVTVLIWKA